MSSWWAQAHWDGGTVWTRAWVIQFSLSEMDHAQIGRALYDLPTSKCDWHLHMVGSLLNHTKICHQGKQGWEWLWLHWVSCWWVTNRSQHHPTGFWSSYCSTPRSINQECPIPLKVWLQYNRAWGQGVLGCLRPGSRGVLVAKCASVWPSWRLKISGSFIAQGGHTIMVITRRGKWTLVLAGSLPKMDESQLLG